MMNEKAMPTPGKGEVIAIKGSYKQPFQVRVGDKVVAQCLGDQLEPDAASIGEARKNAELIAAAFTAAHEVTEMIGPHGRYDPIKAIQALPELIHALHEVSHHSDDEGYMVVVDRALARTAGKEGSGDE